MTTEVAETPLIVELVVNGETCASVTTGVPMIAEFVEGDHPGVDLKCDRVALKARILESLDALAAAYMEEDVT